MRTAAAPLRASKQTTLQRTLTSSLNELGVEAALVAIYEREDGPLVAQGWRGLTPREVQTILRTLSAQDLAALSLPAPTGDDESLKAVRLRMITPGAKSLLGVPLRHNQRTYGVLVVGRKESAALAKKEKSLIEHAGSEITGALERAALFDGTLILSRPLVAHEPAPTVAPSGTEPLAPTPFHATPETQERIAGLLEETAATLPFDYAWVTRYDPLAGLVEVLGLAGEQRGEHKKDFKPGHRLALDASASGWAVRHRKPRVDHDLASTQGRFQDHKHLYRDRFRSAMVVPYFVRGQVGGTVTFASKTPMQYTLADARSLEPLIAKLGELLQQPVSTQVANPPAGPPGEAPAAPAALTSPVPSEPLIRKQERQAAIG